MRCFAGVALLATLAFSQQALIYKDPSAPTEKRIDDSGFAHEPRRKSVPAHERFPGHRSSRRSPPTTGGMSACTASRAPDVPPYFPKPLASPQHGIKS